MDAWSIGHKGRSYIAEYNLGVSADPVIYEQPHITITEFKGNIILYSVGQNMPKN